MNVLEAYEQVISQMEQVCQLMEENLPATRSANPIIAADAQRVQRDMRETMKRIEALADKVWRDAGMKDDEQGETQP